MKIVLEKSSADKYLHGVKLQDALSSSIYSTFSLQCAVEARPEVHWLNFFILYMSSEMIPYRDNKHLIEPSPQPQ